MITDWVGGVKKGQNLDYVIFEWSLLEKARLEKLKAEKTLDNATLTLALKFEDFSRVPLKTLEIFWVPSYLKTLEMFGEGYP